MKTLLTALITAIAIAAPAAEARVPTHHKTGQVSSGVHAKTAAKKKTTAKHKKVAKKGHKKSA
ncbi:Ni/Co efflux regulator RcnB [Pelomonas saccharophila]|jgi:hypothetical protein|uniref:Ni/Co efflux regulator RcnB n=1 Tax=Roseateles saccharophilus TaxID=304 RepID=A0ABU1YLQ6_ROSSA|nr:hypothetical protein [Roseateles saccharophilus]MDR7269797.1 Ni/Co efflux regulator RcnB [Roseateles saccharophilus]